MVLLQLELGVGRWCDLLHLFHCVVRVGEVWMKVMEGAGINGVVIGVCFFLFCCCCCFFFGMEGEIRGQWLEMEMVFFLLLLW